jgi:FkbM family methyltransferase
MSDEKYFIDCGAHCGESILTAKQRFGVNTHVISFEPIPYLANQLKEIHENNNTVQILNAAVWINDDIKKIYVSTDITDGSSLLGKSINNLDESVYINVPCVDLSKWLLETFTEQDYVILKLDIEGAEYEVLNKMINDGSIKLIKELHGEWHDNKISDAHTLELSKKIYKYLDDNNIKLNVWEIHIPTIGKANQYLADRPKTLKAYI